MYEYRIKSVDKIVDGDTIDVTIDLGFDILHKTRVRLYGINTPEVRTRDLEEKKRGLDAKERLTDLLLSCFLEDHHLVLQTKEKGKYGRYLGILIRRAKVVKEGEEIELDLNQQLVLEGHAVDYFGGKR
ncbi:MAG TPA: thermonuclease family protein [Flavobacteriales bacterium]|nr:thermonuclease family protein [Flavobacteriales bacterium]